MGSRSKTPHNALFIDTFADVEHASSFLTAILPDFEAVVEDLTNQSDEELAELKVTALMSVDYGSG